MLLYRVNDDNISYENSDNYSFMMNLIMKDYANYFKASEYLQTKYEICLQAIYSCLSQVNNYKSKSTGYDELSRFLNVVNKKSGIDMRIVSKDKLYVKQRCKRRLVYY